MFTMDAPCARCAKKNECPARTELISGISQITTRLNTEPEFSASPGDGIVIIACQAFLVAAQ